MADEITKAVEVDWVGKYGTDAQTVKEITNNSDAVFELLKKKRTANSEAKEQREVSANLSGILKLGDSKKILQVQRDLTSKAVSYNQLDEEEVKIANYLIKQEAIDTTKLELTEIELNEILGVEPEAKDTPDPKKPVEPVDKKPKDSVKKDVEKDTEAAKELQELKNENLRMKQNSKFRDMGVDPKFVKAAIASWNDPEYPEEVSPEDRKKLDDANIANFRKDYSSFFPSNETRIDTHNSSFTNPPRADVSLETAKSKGSVETISELLKRGQKGKN